MRKILLVEDQFPYIPQGILEAIGAVEVEIARSGDEALEMCLCGAFDLVILDLRLPGLPGMDVLEALRRADPDMPVVICSAFGDKKTRERVTALGAAAFFQKPPNFRRLHQKIMELLAQRDARRLRARETIRLEGVQSERLALMRRLMKLRERAARCGTSTPPEVLTEIEDIEQAIGTQI